MLRIASLHPVSSKTGRRIAPASFIPVLIKSKNYSQMWCNAVKIGFVHTSVHIFKDAKIAK